MTLPFHDHLFRTLLSPRNPTRHLSDNSESIEGPSQCSTITSLETSFQSEIEGFGVMFTVRSKKLELRILTLEFSSFLGPSGGQVDVMVYTKLGDYTGYENIPSEWTLISEATIKTARLGLGTLIPTNNFTSVSMEPNQRRAFYVTLKSMQLRYSEANGIIGDVASQDSHFEVHVGGGLMEFPFSRYLFEPRLFNGLIYYEIAGNCNDLLETTRVPLQFTVLHDNTITFTQVQSQINSIMNTSITTLLQTDTQLKQFQSSFELKIANVTTTISQVYNIEAVAECQTGSTKNCVAIVTTITFEHSEGLSSGQVTYEALLQQPTFTAHLNKGKFNVTYAGELPISSNLILTLKGVPEGQQMEQNYIDYFQKTTKTFLKEQMLNLMSLNVLNVMVTNQSDSSRRYRRLDSSSSLDVTVTITGEYIPPLFVDYGDVISDAIRGGSGLLADDLRNNGAKPVFLKTGGADYFATLQSVNARLANETQVSSPPGNSNELKWWIPTLCVLLPVAFVFGCCIVLKVRSRNKHLLNNQMNTMKCGGLETEMDKSYDDPIETSTDVMSHSQTTKMSS
jgi:hypothetical protein